MKYRDIVQEIRSHDFSLPSSPLWILLAWGLGFLHSLTGARSFSELGGMFAKAGGQYAYLKEAYGELPAFLYAWVTFVVINGSAIAALSLTFAKYFAFILPLGERGTLAVAVPAILGMASVNILQHAHPQAGPGLCRHRVSAAGTAFLFLLPEAVGNGRRPSGSL